MNTTVPPAAPPIPAFSQRPWLGFFLDILIAFATLVVVTLGGMMVWGLWRAFSVVSPAPAPGTTPDAVAQAIGQPGAVLMLVLGSLSMLVAALVVYYGRRRATVPEKAVSRAAIAEPRTWVESIGLGLGLFAFSTALMWGLEQWGHTPEPTNLEMLQQALAVGPWLLLLVAVVIAPISEELLFRRALFGRFWAAGKPGVGMLVSSLAFAFMHEVPGMSASPLGMTLILLVFYALMGASMAWIYQRTRTLWAPILTHATNNLLACLMLMAGYAS